MAALSEKKVQHFGRTNGEVSGKYTRDGNPTFAQGGRKGETRTCTETPGPDPKALAIFQIPQSKKKKIVFSRKFLLHQQRAPPPGTPLRSQTGPKHVDGLHRKDGSFLGITDQREFCFLASENGWKELV